MLFSYLYSKDRIESSLKSSIFTLLLQKNPFTAFIKIASADALFLLEFMDCENVENCNEGSNHQNIVFFLTYGPFLQ